MLEARIGKRCFYEEILEWDKDWTDFDRFSERALPTRQIRGPQGRGLMSRWN